MMMMYYDQEVTWYVAVKGKRRGNPATLELFFCLNLKKKKKKKVGATKGKREFSWGGSVLEGVVAACCAVCFSASLLLFLCSVSAVFFA